MVERMNGAFSSTASAAYQIAVSMPLLRNEFAYFQRPPLLPSKSPSQAARAVGWLLKKANWVKTEIVKNQNSSEFHMAKNE